MGGKLSCSPICGGKSKSKKKQPNLVTDQVACDVCHAVQSLSAGANVFVCETCRSVNRVYLVAGERRLSTVPEPTVILDNVTGVVPVSSEVMTKTITPCSVCLDNPGDMVILPCGHAGICQSCAVHIASNEAVGGSCCPKCRTDIDQLVRIGKLYDTSIQGCEVLFSRRVKAPPSVPPPPGLEKVKGPTKS
ncbi:hypothetical protein FOZ61_004027 [Perkinsus olseni]|uniref:RING-type domain-containing protein n=1 Tax=Perkinsus olseni TaxID=32597 RepID=A0A7J6LND9_PEROL|nr:hypothetical protein FOZ61_004027 [Perkinsus olseni]KAF4670737.1 hypothetical protein FOL46_000649 [Perkinsus olseni]